MATGLSYVELRAAKPVRTYAYLKVVLFPDEMMYFIGSRGLLVRYMSFFLSVKLCC